MDTRSIAELKFSGPAKYRLIIKGCIPEEKHELFGSMSVNLEQAEKSDCSTILEGELLDQAQLSGLLNTIYSLRLPLVEVQYIKPIS